ncbi:MAG: phosphoribosylformylglycinamidine cyclo-ligase [Saprospiraceae bacterium]|nr:phosphoribosylformylglycinamidine cyclo-ligase [Saprospiraceae bacterium]
MADQYKYDQRGVSATKSEVHEAIKGLDKGLFPLAFCKILPDVAGGDPDYCNLMHADTAGTKTSLAYMYWKETGDLSVWEGIAQDAIVMNLDDMACVGCVDDILLSSTIGRNKNLITGEVIARLIQTTTRFAETMHELGMDLHLAGGETADVGDIVRTIDVGYTAFGRMKRADLIVNKIQPGDVIVGWSSSGQATYESAYNGGMGSNGLTSARHDVLSKIYLEKYPDAYDSNTNPDVLFTGSKLLTDTIEVNGEAIPVGKLILSPTRTFIPSIRKLLEGGRSSIHGMIHCTGGGQAKVLHFMEEGVRVVKNSLFEVPPLFKLIQEESGTPWQEMYQVFNMGHRLEVYIPQSEVSRTIEAAKAFDIEAQVIGYVESAEKSEVRLETPQGTFIYS